MEAVKPRGTERETRIRYLSFKDDGHLVSWASELMGLADEQSFNRHSEILSRVSVALFEGGKSAAAIAVGKQIAGRAIDFDNIVVHRKTANILGAQYCDTADFATAMTYLESAVVLSRQIGDPTIEAACLANVTAVLQEMGHYRQAIGMADRVLQLDDMSYMARMLKLQCASNGLFAAHRIGDSAAAARFLDLGQAYISSEAMPLRRVFFERGRVLYLVDLGKTQIAIEHLNETELALADVGNPRIHVLLTIARAICDWSSGFKRFARDALEALYLESKRTRLYHHFVLQGLIKVYSDASSPSEAAIGLAYAKELVEYTTSVKKAKFYRQLADKREQTDRSAS